VTEQRTPWDDVQDIATSIGHEAFFEPRVITPPPVFCEPQTPNHVVDPDFGWPYPKGIEPDVDDPEVCRVHDDEWWPCAAVRAGRPVTFPPAQVQNVLVMRPKEGSDG
jgi:hypothetical protein